MLGVRLREKLQVNMLIARFLMNKGAGSHLYLRFERFVDSQQYLRVRNNNNNNKVMMS